MTTRPHDARLADIPLPEFGMPDAEPADPARGLRHAPGPPSRGDGPSRLRPTGHLRRPRAQRQPRLADRLRPPIRGGDRDRRPDRAARDPRRQRVFRHRGRRTAAVAPHPVPGRQPARPASRSITAAGRDPRWRGHRCRATGRGRRLEDVRGPNLDRDAGLPRRRAAPADRPGRPGRERHGPADRRGERPARHERGRAAGGARVRRLPDVQRASGACWPDCARG